MKSLEKGVRRKRTATDNSEKRDNQVRANSFQVGHFTTTVKGMVERGKINMMNDDWNVNIPTKRNSNGVDTMILRPHIFN